MAEKENADLRREALEAKQAHKALAQRLEVFEQAMGMPPPPEPQQEAPEAADAAAGGSEVAKRVRALHSDLVLEAVALRKEVAALKTKKGLTTGMIHAWGGKLEGQALEKEMEVLRQRKRRSTSEGGDRGSPGKENLPPDVGAVLEEPAEEGLGADPAGPGGAGGDAA